MLVTDQHTLTRSSHAILLVVFLKPPQPVFDGRVFLGLRFLGTEGVIAEWVEAHGGLLALGEGERLVWRELRLLVSLGHGRHGVERMKG